MEAYHEQVLRAEMSMLGALLGCASPHIHLAGLSEEDVTTDEHRVLLSAMLRLAARREPMDITLVNAEAGKDKRYSPSIAAYMLKCVRETPSPVLVGKYVKTVRSYSDRRRLQAIAERLAGAAGDLMADTPAAVEAAMEELRGIGSPTARWEGIGSIMAESYDNLERLSRGEVTYLPSGIAAIDRRMGGLYRGEMTVLAARPAVGKSAMAMYIATHSALKGRSVAVCSLEMHKMQYAYRMLASQTGIDGKKFRTGKDLDAREWSRIAESCGDLGRMRMHFQFFVPTVEELHRSLRQLKDQQGLDLVVIDYMQLMDTARRTGGDYERITAVSHAIKRMALDLAVPVLSLAQVARPTAKNSPSMPGLDSMRGSGDIEQDADSVIILHEPKTLEDKDIPPRDINTARALMEQGDRYLVVNVAKNRNGECGMFGVAYHPGTMLFATVEHG